MPRAWYDDVLDEIKADLQREVDENSSDDSNSPSKRGPGSLSSQDIGKLLGAVIAAIDEEPIRTDLKVGKRIRVANIEIKPEELRLHVEPLGRKKLPAGRKSGTAPRRRSWPREFRDE